MGSFVEWSEDLSVGIEEIDEQHKVLLGLVNQMHAAIKSRQGNEAVGVILEELADYTRIHFSVEESLMRILHYPDYEEHRRYHEVLINQLAEIRDKLEGGNAAVGFELMHFLKVWLTKHIGEEDNKYSAFFIEAGAQPTFAKKGWGSRLWGR